MTCRDFSIRGFKAVTQWSISGSGEEGDGRGLVAEAHHPAESFLHEIAHDIFPSAAGNILTVPVVAGSRTGNIWVGAHHDRFLCIIHFGARLRCVKLKCGSVVHRDSMIAVPNLSLSIRLASMVMTAGQKLLRLARKDQSHCADAGPRLKEMRKRCRRLTECRC